ncbi:MAG: DUF2403 domain-containing protein [Bdellovibrionales bacterium]|nr:DUF2403 domain-containing protein [Bdellovibrionales bacterium]
MSCWSFSCAALGERFIGPNSPLDERLSCYTRGI